MTKLTRLATSNQNGGGGKTEIVCNVARALNRRGARCYSTWIQGDGTENLLMRHLYDTDPPSLFDFLHRPEQRDRVAGLTCEREGTSLSPSNTDVTAIEPELTLVRRSGEHLALGLQHVGDGDDCIRVDCSSFRGNLLEAQVPKMGVRK